MDGTAADGGRSGAGGAARGEVEGAGSRCFGRWGSMNHRASGRWRATGCDFVGGAGLPGGYAVVFDAAGGGSMPPGFRCGLDASAGRPMPPGGPGPQGDAGAAAADRTRVKRDYEYFVLFNDLDAAGDYIVTQHGAISTLHSRCACRITLSFVRLWDNRAIGNPRRPD